MRVRDIRAEVEQVCTRGGMLVHLRQWDGQWLIVPPPTVQRAPIGPFADKALALDVAADFFSWGEAA